MKEQHAHLYYREGNSDKEYHAHLAKKDEGWVVNFEYGRRGSTLQTGTKTAEPLIYSDAERIFAKLVTEKKAKGYTEEEGGTPYTATAAAERVSGVAPQLLNPIDEGELNSYINSPEFWMQEKMDGKRMLLRKAGATIVAINRKGLHVGFPKVIEEAALLLKADSFLLDGEAVGTVFYVFDLLEFGGKDFRGRSYSNRYDLAQTVCDKSNVICPLATWQTRDAKRAALKWLRDRKAEGVVFKDANAPYVAGRPASGGSQVKFKFTATCSAIVDGANSGKRSVALVLLDGKKRVAIGNVTIPANFTVPKKGAICEVRYLYAYRGGALFQPVYLGVRDDVERSACTLAQLKFKAETGEEEEAA